MYMAAAARVTVMDENVIVVITDNSFIKKAYVLRKARRFSTSMEQVIRIEKYFTWNFTFVEIIHPFMVSTVDQIACQVTRYCCCKYKCCTHPEGT